MRIFLFLTLFLLASSAVFAQPDKPAYCEELPVTYGAVNVKGATPPPLPRFATTPTTEYKIQVAILRFTDPADFPFHPLLVARYRPCEQVWVVESRDSYPTRAEADKVKTQLANLGYRGAYLTELMAYK